MDKDNYRLLLENLTDGFAYHKIVTDSEGQPADYIFMDVNRAFEKMIGRKKDRIIGKKVTQILPGVEGGAVYQPLAALV